MNTRQSRSPHHDGSEDVGTLWTMHRREHTARCALIARRNGWEVRVLMGRDLLLEERCERADEAFSVAELWKTRMLQDGWRQVVPQAFRGPGGLGFAQAGPRQCGAGRSQRAGS